MTDSMLFPKPCNPKPENLVASHQIKGITQTRDWQGSAPSQGTAILQGPVSAHVDACTYWIMRAVHLSHPLRCETRTPGRLIHTHPPTYSPIHSASHPPRHLPTSNHPPARFMASVAACLLIPAPLITACMDASGKDGGPPPPGTVSGGRGGGSRSLPPPPGTVRSRGASSAAMVPPGLVVEVV